MFPVAVLEGAERRDFAVFKDQTLTLISGFKFLKCGSDTKFKRELDSRGT